MLITYLKENGRIVPPIVTSTEPLTLIDVMGEELGGIYSSIYDYINIVDNTDIFDNVDKYYIDIESKELRLKPQNYNIDKIRYL